MAGPGTFKRMVVTLAYSLDVVWIQCGEGRVLVGVVGGHLCDHTVFQSPGNLGIIAR